MAIASLDNYLAAAKQPIQMTKTASRTSVALIPFSTFDLAGDWTIWVYITFTNTKVSIGEPATFKIYEEGE